MLLRSCQITRVLPCLADPEKIRVIAELPDEIQGVFPYLNATLKGCIYNHAANTLTIKKRHLLITLHARHITLAKIEDEKEAEEVLAWLRDLINETDEKRCQIEPNYSLMGELKALDIYKLLPGTNCRKCGEPACLAFAVKLVGRDIEVGRCTPLFSEPYKGQRNVLLETLRAAGVPAPSDENSSGSQADRTVRVKFSGLAEDFLESKDPGEHSFDFGGRTVRDLLRHLSLGLSLRNGKKLLDEGGNLSPEIIPLLNGMILSGADRFDTRLHGGDLLELLVAPG